MIKAWEPGTWKGKIVEKGAKRGQEAFSQWVFQTQMREGSALRQQICFIPGRESRKTLRIEGEEGRAILLARRPKEQQCP
jgi:hypothetical protein